MFERVVHNVIQAGMDRLDVDEPLLRRALSSPGYSEEEIDNLVSAWSGDQKPRIVHSYARAAAQIPCYAIVLASEIQDQQYLDNSADALAITEVEAFIKQVQAEVGRVVSAQIHRFKFTYQIFTYALNPDVTLAYYNVLRNILLGADKAFALEGFETPSFSGMDLSPNTQYLPENVFARMLELTGAAHLLIVNDLDLGPWATGRGNRIEGIHIANAVVGVDPRVHPVVE